VQSLQNGLPGTAVQVVQAAQGLKDEQSV